MSIEAFENAVNEVSDKDWSWWPFLWLRPEKHASMTLARLFFASFLFGLPCGGLSSLAFAFVRPDAHDVAPFLALAFPMLLFFVASALVGPMWNRRAERLRAQPQRF
jgi:hypothetical protein